MVFKSTSSISRFHHKNQLCTQSQNITKKLLKISLPNQTSKIWHILADISVLGAYFSKPIFALKPWVRAAWFEYHEPYIPNNFFFTYKGVRAILSAISSSENGQNLNFWVRILVQYIYIQVFWLWTISISNFCVFHYALLTIPLFGLTPWNFFFQLNQKTIGSRF